MDIYLTSLAIGGVGLVAMAASGIGQHGHGGAHGAHGGHGGHDGGHEMGHFGHTGTHHVGAHHGGAHHDGAHHGGAHHGGGAHGGAGQLLLSLMSPRLLFSVCLGLGTTGVLLQRLLPSVLAGVPLFAAAVAGGAAFEMLLVRPIWNAFFRFESAPALTLESAVASEAKAVSNFDANGQGLIAIEMDGQVVQLLGTLQSDDRAMAPRIAAGTRLRVEEVDAARNRCTVSLV